MARQLTDEERKEAQEHQEVLLAARAVIVTPQGKKLFKYFLKSFEVAQAIPRDLEPNQLHHFLGFHEAGTHFFKLLSEADSIIAGQLLTQVEKERQDEIYQATLTEPSQ